MLKCGVMLTSDCRKESFEAFFNVIAIPFFWFKRFSLSVLFDPRFSFRADARRKNLKG